MEIFFCRHPDVSAFGIWLNSRFKVFVSQTDEQSLREELTKINPTFFTKYRIEIETAKHKYKLSHLTQGDGIQAEIPNKALNIPAGTLGSIVTKADNENKKCAITCNYLFHEEGEHAFPKSLEGIGTWCNTNKENRCDFAAIRIKKAFSEKCVEDRKNDNGQVISKSGHTKETTKKIDKG